MAGDVTLYALSTCPYCRMTRKYLDEHEVAYEHHEVDLMDGEERQAAIDKVKALSGGTSFPVLVVGEEVVVGFNKSRMADLLGI